MEPSAGGKRRTPGSSKPNEEYINMKTTVNSLPMLLACAGLAIVKRRLRPVPDVQTQEAWLLTKPSPNPTAMSLKTMTTTTRSSASEY